MSPLQLLISEFGQLTTLRLMTRSLATLKLPQSILSVIVMDTLHSGHHVVSRTKRKGWSHTV